MNTSRQNIQRILREDLGCKSYKKIIQPKLNNLQKSKRVKFTNWMLNNYSKEDTKKCLFTDEKYFDLDDIYNLQNDRVWTPSREEADRNGGFHQKTKHGGKVMVWLGACAKGLTTPVIFENETMNAEIYINEVLPIALECSDKMLGSNWISQQDSARPHIHNLTQECVPNIFAISFPRSVYPPILLIVCSLECSLWNELAQCMNWNQIRTKTMLIEEIKCSITKVDKKKF